MKVRKLALALAASVGLSACVTGGGPTEYVAIDERSAISAVNAFRAEHGLGPLSANPALASAAKSHSQRMAASRTLSHSLGGPLTARLRSAGYARWNAAAENIGMGYQSYGAALTGWINSPGHRRNLLNPNVTQAGVGAAQPEGAPYPRYWTIILAAPR